MKTSEQFIEITYIFHYQTKDEHSYPLRFEADTMALVQDKRETPPDWARLENNKCTNCPLNEKDHPYCPVAKNIALLNSKFVHEVSFRPTVVCVQTKERTYLKNATVQEGLYGIFGLVMATSGCPHMELFKPMARFHLPFSSTMETMVRNTSLYLLKQFLLKKNGMPFDADFKNLEHLLRQVQEVNRGFIKRIRTLSQTGDAERNAIVSLDGFAGILSIELSSDFDKMQKVILLSTDS